MNSTLLAVDLGKYNSVLCWYEPVTRTSVFRTVTTTPDDLRRELTRQPAALVVSDACSLAGCLHDLGEEHSGSTTLRTYSSLSSSSQLEFHWARAPLEPRDTG